MNLFHDLDFIVHNDFVFKKRFSGDEGYFKSEGRPLEQKDIYDNPKIWESNFIPDCRAFALIDDPKRGGLSTNVFFDLSNGAMTSHISEFPAGTYMKAHYHGPGTHLICLSGQGYELMWPREAGSTAKGFAPPDLWFHQHFSTGKEPVKLLAFHDDWSKKYVGLAKDWGRAKGIEEGGTQINYEEEDPEIRRLFREELARTGAPWRMSKYFPGE